MSTLKQIKHLSIISCRLDGH